jgi:uncharacterized protein (DUF1800 family)
MGIMRAHHYLPAKIAVFSALFAICCFVFISDVFAAESKKEKRPGTEPGTLATPTKIFTGRTSLPAPTSQVQSVVTKSAVVDPIEIEAGHVLRRIGFGPNKKDLKTYAKKGFASYINEQLNPNGISDGKANKKMPKVPKSEDNIEDSDMIRRWYIRMIWTRRILQEKMTLIWHEHFSTSQEKVVSGALMLEHENNLRKYALGNFRDFLIKMSQDQAMLIWLDNDYNRGDLYNLPTDTGQKPNENYAREFLQLFSTGTTLLNIDGTPILDGSNNPIPAYTEEDILHVSLAMSGWNTPYPRRFNNVEFVSCIHNDDTKTLFAGDVGGGVVIPGHAECDPAGEDETTAVVDAVLTRRADTVAAFISKMLIQKLVTETPDPAYVAAVATVFRDTNWNIKEAVRTILNYSAEGVGGTPEILKAENIRSMHKEPIEYAIGAVRAFGAKTKDYELLDWTFDMGQLAYWPPSVFSFYPPGNKGALVSTAYVFIRDRVADEYVRGWSDTYIQIEKLMSRNNLDTAEDAVAFLEEQMLAHPISEPNRTTLLNYAGGATADIDDTKMRGLIWLVMTSPDYQRN